MDRLADRYFQDELHGDALGELLGRGSRVTGYDLVPELSEEEIENTIRLLQRDPLAAVPRPALALQLRPGLLASTSR